MIEIGVNRSGGEAEVKLGEPFVIRLVENPTTGYRWHLHCSPSDTIEVDEDEFQPPEESCGGGGFRRWRCHAVRPGIVTIELELKRSWEKTPADTFRFDIRVRAE